MGRIMAAPNILRRLEEKAVAAEQMISNLKKEIAELNNLCESHKSSQQECRQLLQSNRKLALEIEEAKQQLIRLEVANGKLQIPLPAAGSVPPVQKCDDPSKSDIKTPSAPAAKSADSKKSNKAKPTEPQAAAADTNGDVAATGGKTKKSKKPQPPKQPERAEDDVSRLDLRVGLIVTAERHPDADSLYVEKVEVGEEQQLTVVSGLAGRIPLEAMQNRPAMVMCASDPGGKVEILTPPSGAIPGDRVALDGAELLPPDTQLKGKNWEAVAAKLRTRPDLVAAFDGKALTVPGKGNITTASLAGVPIK
ncbi:hypothetical protein B566_EDAN010584 [Ephemera danica]|nr:hypothetical protein B566_EDAN010584 [Ephemera danica]